MPKMLQSESDVLIIGGGPVGLTAALSLTHRGVGAQIVDQISPGTPRGHALALHSRTLDLFSELGVAFDIVITSITGLVLLRLALAAFRAVRHYRNYLHFHEAYIGTEGRERKEAYQNLVWFGPQPDSYNKFFRATKP